MTSFKPGLVLLFGLLEVSCTTPSKMHPSGAIEKEVLPTRQEVPGVGFQVSVLGILENKLGDKITLYQAMPCTECDLAPELVVINERTKRSVKNTLPGQYFVGENKECSTDAFGFYGSCLEIKKPGVIEIFKEKQPEQRTWSQSETWWKFTKAVINFDPAGNPVLQENTIDEAEFTRERNVLATSSCHALPHKKINTD